MVRQVALSGGEAWAVTEERIKKLEVSEKKCLKALVNIVFDRFKKS